MIDRPDVIDKYILWSISVKCIEVNLPVPADLDVVGVKQPQSPAVEDLRLKSVMRMPLAVKISFTSSWLGEEATGKYRVVIFSTTTR